MNSSQKMRRHNLLVTNVHMVMSSGNFIFFLTWSSRQLVQAQ
jgi:transcription elongation factor GreA-like protein